MKRVIKVYSIFILTFVLFQTNSLYAEEYKGKVVTLSDQILSISTGAYDRGWILYIAKLGQILTPSVYDSDGKIVQKGTILIHGDPSTWSPYYYAYKKELELAGENKVLTYKLFEMTKTLASDNAISEQQLSSGRTQYEGALGQFANNEQLVIQAELTVERMISRAVFEGIVTNVTQASGSDVGNAPAIEFVQLNPIGIKIDMPIEKQMRLKPSTSIQIYIEGIDEPFEGSHLYSIISEDGYTITACNYPIIKKNEILQDRGIPILRDWLPVINFNCLSKLSESLAIPPTSILHDEKGDYVWRAKGQKVMRTDKGIDYTFPIEKVYISQGDLIRYHTGYNKVVSLKDKGLLEKNDLVLNNPPETLKENQTVIYPQQTYLFMPGDDVKVSITE